MIHITRRQFARTGAGLLAASHLRAAEDHFAFGIIADTHIIDTFYKGPEGNPEDTASILHSAERLQSARTLLNSLQPKLDLVFLVGDYFHDYPSIDLDFYGRHKTRIDLAKETDRRLRDARPRGLRQPRLRRAKGLTRSLA